MNIDNADACDGAILTDSDVVRLQEELENLVSNLKWVSAEMKVTNGLQRTWMNLEIDRRHIMRELHAGRRLVVKDESAVDLDQPFVLD